MSHGAWACQTTGKVLQRFLKFATEQTRCGLARKLSIRVEKERCSDTGSKRFIDAPPTHQCFLPVTDRSDPAFLKNRHDIVPSKRQPQHWQIAEELRAADFGATRKISGHCRKRFAEM
jgi:hypothetical protein